MHDEVRSLKEDGSYKDICKMKERLMEGFKSEVDAGGFHQMDIHEAGQVVDMIKDLAEAEEKCVKACYYASIIKAMEEAEEHDDRMGYNSRRYASGRYAPKGRGMRMGYVPYMEYDPEFEEEMRGNVRLGYDQSGKGNRSQSGSRMGYDDDRWNDDPRYGRAFNDYKNAKRHYTETKSQQDKDRMDMSANEHMMSAIASFKEMWKDADPAMRKKMHADLSALVNEMKVQ